MRRQSHSPSFLTECKVCQRPFRRYVGRTRHFCSRRCYGKWQRIMVLALSNDSLRSEILATLAEPIRRAA
jgi:hypothetical protein